MHRKFKKLLHDYKKEAFHAEHDPRSAEEIAAECMKVTDDVLREKFEYHFHKLPDANRAEIINMINNYVREAILPPIVERIMHRQVVLERRLEAVVHLLEQVLETLSTDPVEGELSR